MEDNRIIDTSMPHPDQEDVEEKEFIVNCWMPMQVEINVKGTDEEDAKENALAMLKSIAPKNLVCDWDTSEAYDWDFDEEY